MEHNYTKSYKSIRLTVIARLTYCIIFLLFFTGSITAQERVKELEKELASQKEIVNQLITEFRSVKDEITKLREEKDKYSVRGVSLDISTNDVTEAEK